MSGCERYISLQFRGGTMNEKAIAIFCICDEVVKSYRLYENHKSFRAKIFRGKEFHGYTASKKQYFFGKCI
jgi:hypothetical protein